MESQLKVCEKEGNDLFNNMCNHILFTAVESQLKVREREGTKHLFNNTCNAFYLRLLNHS